jgi:hypothetical protein
VKDFIWNNDGVALFQVFTWGQNRGRRRNIPTVISVEDFLRVVFLRKGGNVSF